ncbi:MAG: hypothetical protein WCS11_02630 [Dysgonamonadaceae bacterium]|nr:hypothetical protein [Dysgonamonadaceae bacterium]
MHTKQQIKMPRKGNKQRKERMARKERKERKDKFIILSADS